MNRYEGIEEGDTCNRGDCQGILEYYYDEPCTCNVSNAPCRSCIHSYLICPDCGWEEERD